MFRVGRVKVEEGLLFLVVDLLILVVDLLILVVDLLILIAI